MRPLALVLLLAAAGCQAEDAPFARAKVIETLDEAIGGPTANARVGDLLLENDQIRAVIEQGQTSYVPTDVGGALIDLDLQRSRRDLRGGVGLDQLGEIAPIVNLAVAQAVNVVHVRATKSKAGAEVTVAAEAKPVFKILLALDLLVDRQYATSPRTQNMYTEYELRPGERLLRIRSTVGVNVAFCRPEPADGCNAECDDILYDDDCECPSVPARCTQGTKVMEASALPDRPVSSLLDILLGDLPRPLSDGVCKEDKDCKVAGQKCVSVLKPLGGDLKVCRGPDARDAGLFLGDLLVFGAHLTPFVRGIGYDTESDIRRLFDTGRDTLSDPLEVDAVFATGDRMSLGYLSPKGHILVPIFRGPFSLGTTHAATCPTNQPACLEGSLIRFERWISVGDGDVASAQAPLLAAAGTTTGSVRGTVTDVPAGQPRSGISVFALRDPRGLACDAACQTRPACAEPGANPSLDDVRRANRCRTQDRMHPDGTSEVESFATTDPGTDAVKDGRFALDLPAGGYYLVALDGTRAQSRLVPVTVTAGATSQAHLDLPQPATLDYTIFDEHAQVGPGKVTIGKLPGAACADKKDCASGEECLAGACNTTWTALVPLELGGKRPLDGIVYSEYSASGRGQIQLPAGEYDVEITRGPQFSMSRQRVTLRSRLTTPVVGYVRRVVDRDGWISAALHVHAGNSVDSGVSLIDRVTGFLAEDMDLLSSADHDYITDYVPLLKEMGVSERMNTMRGVEITTQEYGHYVAFPQAYRAWKDGERLPGNDTVQWRGHPPQEIMDLAREHATPDTPVVVDVPHPYDYFDQYQIDPVTLEPVQSLLALINPVLAPDFFSGDYDVTELVNTKNFHRIRRATVSEVAFYARGLDGLIADLDAGRIDVPTFSQRWLDLSMEAVRRRLHRTVAEQEAELAGQGTDIACLCGGNGECGAGQICQRSTLTCVTATGPDTSAEPPADAMCVKSRGVIDDWFNMLNRGMFRAGVAGDDVHDREAGIMRTMVRTDGTTPPFIQPKELTEALKAGHAVVTNGPMMHFTVDGVGVGGTRLITAGSEVTLRIQVEKAPWYDLDRLEVYRNAHLIAWANGCDRARGKDDADPDSLPCMKEGDVVEAGEWVIKDKPERDSWYVVLVYGLEGRTLAPLYETQVLAEINTPEITQRLFTIIPGLSEFKFPKVPSIYPTFPFVFSNPVWVDVGGDGWTPPLPPPSWCRQGDIGCQPRPKP